MTMYGSLSWVLKARSLCALAFRGLNVTQPVASYEGSVMHQQCWCITGWSAGPALQP